MGALSNNAQKPHKTYKHYTNTEKSGDCEQSKNIHKVQKTENMPFI